MYTFWRDLQKRLLSKNGKKPIQSLRINNRRGLKTYQKRNGNFPTYPLPILQKSKR